MRFKTFRKYLQELTTGVPENGDLVPYYDADYAQDAKTTDFEAFSDAALEVAVPLPPVGGGVGQILMIDTATPLVTEWVDPGGIGGPGTGANLTWDAGTSRVISDTGTDATLTVADGVDPGLMSVLQHDKLDAIEALADVTDATNVAAAGAVMQTTIAAKGDLYVGTANDTVGILTAGADGEVVVADSTESTGLKYEAPLRVPDLADALEGRFGFYPIADRIFHTGSNGDGTADDVGLALNALHFIPFLPSRSCTIVSMSAYVGTGAGVETFALAIYESLDGLPDALVDSVAGLSAATSGIKTATFAAPLSLTGGALYFAALLKTAGVSAQFRYHENSLGGRVNSANQNVSESGCYRLTGQLSLPDPAAGPFSIHDIGPTLFVTVGTVT